MATVEHCLFCFETLAAELEHREPMKLDELIKSWAEYTESLAPGAAAAATTKKLPALSRIAADDVSLASSSSSSSSSTSGTSTPSSLLAAAGSTPAGEASTTPATSTSSLTVPDESPLFVTWNAEHPRHGPQLRGCIGTFEPQPLAEGLASYALTSALHDTRFSPISRRELLGLQAAVTLLTDFEDAADADDWVLGTHGLRISFRDARGRRYGATYLPDVAPEQEWSKEETIVSLMRKAGWVGRRDSWRDVDLKVVRYQGRKASLDYPEFRAWRDWVEKGSK